MSSEIKKELQKLYDDDDMQLSNAKLFELHTKLYYENQIKLGRKIGCLIIENNLWENKFKVQKNQLFYLKNLSKLPNSVVYNLTEPFIPLENPKNNFKNEKYNILNPSIYKDDDGDIYVNIRHVCFKGHNYESMNLDNKIRTYNTFGLLEDNKLSENYYIIKDCGNYKKVRNNVLGFEDLKLFKFNNQIYFTCTSYETSISTDVLLGKIDSLPNNNIYEVDNVFPLHGSMVSDKRAEKNWMPILDSTEKLKLVYSVFPLHIVYVDEENKNVNTLYKKEWNVNLGFWRGSSCLVPHNYGFLFIIHEVYFPDYPRQNRHYVHRFGWLSNDYETLKYSDPFFVERKNPIEYVNGLVIKDDKIYISYGDDDKEAKLLIMDINHLEILLDNETQ